MEQTIDPAESYEAAMLISATNLSQLRTASIVSQINGGNAEIINSQYEATCFVIESLLAAIEPEYRATKSFYMEDKNV